LRVGGEEMCKVDVRIITATNANLASRVAENRFREDLFYRLDVASLHIPPLRERPEDLDIFINYFLGKESAAKQIPLKQFSEQAMALLRQHTWPGNIRELSNTVAQALLLSKGQQIECEDLPERILKETSVSSAATQKAIGETETQDEMYFSGFSGQASGLSEILETFELKLYEAINFREGFDFERFSREISSWRDELVARIIENAIEDTYGNQVKAAKLLGITPRALRYHLQKARRSQDTE
jgi:DNA-binding NtrC family response regulator